MDRPLNIAPTAWTVFVPYSWLHAVTVAVCMLLVAAPTLVGRGLDKNGERLLRRMLAATAVAFWFAYLMWWNWNGLDWLTLLCPNAAQPPHSLGHYLTERNWRGL